MSASQGWLLERDVCLTGVVTIERCLPYRDGYYREMSTLKGWLLERDCLPYRGGYLREMATLKGFLVQSYCKFSKRRQGH